METVRARVLKWVLSTSHPEGDNTFLLEKSQVSFSCQYGIQIVCLSESDFIIRQLYLAAMQPNIY